MLTQARADHGVALDRNQKPRILIEGRDLHEILELIENGQDLFRRTIHREGIVHRGKELGLKTKLLNPFRELLKNTFHQFGCRALNRKVSRLILSTLPRFSIGGFNVYHDPSVPCRGVDHPCFTRLIYSTLHVTLNTWKHLKERCNECFRFFKSKPSFSGNSDRTSSIPDAKIK